MENNALYPLTTESLKNDPSLEPIVTSVCEESYTTLNINVKTFSTIVTKVIHICHQKTKHKASLINSLLGNHSNYHVLIMLSANLAKFTVTDSSSFGSLDSTGTNAQSQLLSFPCRTLFGYK